MVGRRRAMWVVAALLSSATARGAAPAWRYDVGLGEHADDLEIEATIDGGGLLEVEEGAERYVSRVEIADGRGWRSLARRGNVWPAPACASGGCRIRYRFRLRAAAEALDSDQAQRIGPVIQAPPSTWLLHPRNAPAGGTYRFRVTTPRGQRFVSGVHAVDESTYEADIAQLADASYSAFGPLEVERIEREGGRIDVAFAPARRLIAREQIVAAVARAAEVVGRYFGRFPVERALILVLPSEDGDAHGRTLGATVMLRIGETMTAEALRQAWVPAHELVHLAFPQLAPRYSWMAEGLATYVESIARARAGDLSPARMWRDLVEGLPNGLPEPGDRGLDNTHTWGRTYWGGALFCLLADLEIRERTANRRSLDDALRGILARGGNMTARWPLERALEVGDEAAGVPVLMALYRKMRARPVDVDLPSLWRRLGVRASGRSADLDDTAPLAATRRSITESGAR